MWIQFPFKKNLKFIVVWDGENEILEFNLLEEKKNILRREEEKNKLNH